jgi:hypothetical protein
VAIDITNGSSIIIAVIIKKKIFFSRELFSGRVKRLNELASLINNEPKKIE